MQKIVIQKLGKNILIWTIVIGIALPSLAFLSQNVVCYLKTGINHIFTPTNVKCYVHDVFCSHSRKEIIKFATQEAMQKSILNINHTHFYKTLKKKFPFIKSANWKFTIPQELHMNIVGVSPTYVVNNQFILGNKKRLFSKNLFEDAILKDLPNIKISPTWIKTKLDQNVYNFITKITPERLKQFDIFYQTPWHIKLTPNNPTYNFQIISNEQSFFDQKKFNSLKPILQDLFKKGSVKTKAFQSKHASIMLDLRIKDQIIVKFVKPFRGGRQP